MSDQSNQSNQFQPIQTNGNGLPPTRENGLPPTREAIIEQGMRIQQETAAERDELRREVAQLRSDIAAYKVMVEAQTTQLSQADSRVEAMTLIRDEAVARRAAVEAVLASMLAIGRAFQIKSEPLITGTGDHDQDDPRDRDPWPSAGSGYSRDIG